MLNDYVVVAFAAAALVSFGFLAALLVDTHRCTQRSERDAALTARQSGASDAGAAIMRAPIDPPT